MSNVIGIIETTESITSLVERAQASVPTRHIRRGGAMRTSHRDYATQTVTADLPRIEFELRQTYLMFKTRLELRDRTGR
jgi:hypothetical protein